MNKYILNHFFPSLYFIYQLLRFFFLHLEYQKIYDTKVIESSVSFALKIRIFIAFLYAYNAILIPT